MAPSDWITIAGILAILGFLWNLHHDVAGLGERMARLEGAMEVLSGNVNTLLQVSIDRKSEWESRRAAGIALVILPAEAMTDMED